MQNRVLIREMMRAKRTALSEQECLVAASNLIQNILINPDIEKAQHIAAYLAYNNEIDPLSWIKKCYQTKNFYLPVINSQSKQMQFALYKANSVLKPNQYGILEPADENQLNYPAHELDVVLVPLVAFDLKGNRLGTGAGYYDRTFAFLNKPNKLTKPKLIGLAYEFQKSDSIDHAPWDVLLDGVITDYNIYQFSPSL